MGWLGPVGDWIEDKTTDVYHRATGTLTEDEKRAQQKAINDQAKAYQAQTEITRAELATKRNEVAVEKRRIEEKQIRSLRRNYRSQSLLGGAYAAESDMTSQLGG